MVCSVVVGFIPALKGGAFSSNFSNCDPDSDSKSVWFEDEPDDNCRPLCADDVKVTVKWSKNPNNDQLAHLAGIENQHHYKLGIRFERWRKCSPEQRLITLGHELGHARYKNHGKAYWAFVFDIWSEILDHKDTIEGWYGEDELGGFDRHALCDDPLDWEYVRARMVDDVYNNADSDIRDEMVERASDRFDYPHEHIVALDWSRCHGNEPTVPVSDWDGDPESVDPEDIVFQNEYDDATLVERLQGLDDVARSLNVKSFPEIHGERLDDGSIRITENELDAAVLARTATSRAPVSVLL